MSWYSYPAYVPVAERKKKAQEKINKLKKKDESINPIIIVGRNIANTFWGKAWCKNLESYADYDYRVTRGRSYCRNGAILDLQISKGKINAQVQGTRLYKIEIKIQELAKKKWEALVDECFGKIDSLVELLQGKLADNILKIVTDKEKGLFPKSSEIDFDCSCPDHAQMCKHIAAVLFGVGARLNNNPEELFILRKVNHLELINSAATKTKIAKKQLDQTESINDADLSTLFNIEIEDNKEPETRITKSTKKEARPASNKSKKTTKKKEKNMSKNDKKIPNNVQEEIIKRVEDFNSKKLAKSSGKFIPVFKGKFIYLKWKNPDLGDELEHICRLDYNGDLENMDFAIYQYSTETYSYSEFFSGDKYVDGTLEGALKAGYAAYGS